MASYGQDVKLGLPGDLGFLRKPSRQVRGRPEQFGANIRREGAPMRIG